MEVGEWVTEQRNFSKYFYNSPNTSENYPSSNKSSASDFSEYNISVLNKNNLNTLPLVCGFCDYHCKLNIQLNFHRTTHITKCESKTPNTFEKSLKVAEKTESYLEKLTLDHVSSRIICDVCNYECYLVIQLMIHKRVRHGDGASFLSYADKELRSDDNFEKAIFYYFLKTPKDTADREDADVIKIPEEQNPNAQKANEPVKSGLEKAACKYCEFTCKLFIQLKVHKKRYHEKRTRKTSISRQISKENECFQSVNAGETRSGINAIDCIVANDEIKKLQEEKKGGPEIESSGKENEVNNINTITNAVRTEVLKEDCAVSQTTEELFKKVSSKSERFVNSNDNKLNFNYQRSKKRKKKARHEHDKKCKRDKKEENCSKVKNAIMCNVDIKESDIQLYTRKPLQDSIKESKNDNLTFSCSHCTYKCKFSVELRIHENIHRTKSFVIRPVPMNSYGDNIACRIPNCAIKDNDFDMTGNKKDGVLKLAKISQGDPVMKIKNKKIHRDVSNKKILEKIDSMKVNGRFLTTDSMFSCSECNYKCNFAAQLRLHRIVLHGKDNSRKTSPRAESKLSKNLNEKCYILLQDSDKLAVKSHKAKQKAQKLKTDFSVVLDERKLSSNGSQFKCKLPNPVHKNDKRYDKNVPQIKKSDQRKNVVKFTKSPLKHKSFHTGRNIF